MNYFSYFSEIEDTFVRRRGKHLYLSSIDWALMESWKVRGVPLHVALRGIEHAFDSHQSKQRKRSVKSLLYCQEEVEAQYAEWLETRVGSQDEESPDAAEADTSPFPREAVLGHLTGSLEELTRLHRDRIKTIEDELSEAFERATSLLADVRVEYETAATPDTRKLEESLTGIDRMLDEAIRIVVPSDDLDQIESEIEAQLKPYKRHMDKAAFEQTRDNLRRKRLREHFNVPRLSLFYLSL